MQNYEKWTRFIPQTIGLIFNHWTLIDDVKISEDWEDNYSFQYEPTSEEFETVENDSDSEIHRNILK